MTAYSLAAASLLLAGGKLSDLLGRKTTFLIGPATEAPVGAQPTADLNAAGA